MPDFVKVIANVKCPYCGCVIDRVVEIQWGKVPSVLHVGEQVRWLIADDELVPPFTLLEGQTCWNCGDPAAETAYVFDCNRYAVDAEEAPTCPSCGKTIGGVMAIFVSNRLKEVKACTTAEMRSFFGSKLGKADIIILERDGSYNIREDWFNHTIKYVKRSRSTDVIDEQ